MYLWNAGFGTKNYRANNLVAFSTARWRDWSASPRRGPNFAMLNEIPLRLREHAERQEAKPRPPPTM